MPSGFDLPLDASLLGLLPYLFPFFHFFSLFMDSIVRLPSDKGKPGLRLYTSALYALGFSFSNRQEQTVLSCR